MIRPPHPHEIKLLPDIENEADRRYARVGLHRVLAMPPASITSLEHGARRGFADVPRGRWDWAIRLQIMIENRHGHPPWRRTVMSRDLESKHF